MKTKQKIEHRPTTETRKNEVRITTLNPNEMLGKYLGKRLARTWKEEFVDEDTSEVVQIERSETIADSGTLIDNDLLAQIQFFIGTGDIDSVEVSNQQREATLYKSSSLTPWTVTAQIGKKKHKFLLYADSINMAIEVATDYIELNFKELFMFVSAKEFNNCIIIKDELIAADNEDNKEPADEEQISKKFYKIDVSVAWDETGGNYALVVHSANVDSSMLIVNKHLENLIREHRTRNNENDLPIEFKTTILSATIIPCSLIIEKEFSLAYQEP